jgi:hypothetical protein
LHECRIVHFMIHDRISFGGAIIAIGLLYHWITVAPLHDRQTWAWRALVVSGVLGFGSFFAYLGYGYLDTWHGIATLALLPCFVLGLILSHSSLPARKDLSGSRHSLRRWSWNSRHGLGRICLLSSAAGITLGGLTIFIVGMTVVFVPQDIAFLGLKAADLHGINERLVPLIAHDRAGFGGALCCCGATLAFCIWFGRPSPQLWRTLVMVGAIGFGTAIGVHPAIGYNDAVHLTPAVVGACLYAAGLFFTFTQMTTAASRAYEANLLGRSMELPK